MASSRSVIVPLPAPRHPTWQLLAGLTLLTACSAACDAADPVGVAVRVQAEDCPTTGSISAFGTRVHTPEAEASGRRFVTLPPGTRLDIVAPIRADSLILRVSYPDAPQGGGLDGALAVSIDETVYPLPITSRYTLGYGRGRFNSPDVWPEDPSLGKPCHFWAEAALRLPLINAGTRVSIRNPDLDHAVLVDFAEFERLPPTVEPSPDALSFADWHPDRTGAVDCTQELQLALTEAQRQNRVLHLPEGLYQVGVVRIPGVRLQGAGLWRTRFVGPRSRFHFTGGTVSMADFAVFGETSRRNDHSEEDNGFSGVPGPGSRLERIWVERKKCAWWVCPDTDGRTVEDLTIAGWRIRDTMADGINLYNGAHHCVIEDCLVRNTGDDCLAAWSPAKRGQPSGDIVFRRNHVELPWLASGIALYGGGPFTVQGNTIADTVTSGSGIYVSASFQAWPFAGAVRVADNLLLRCGAHESSPGGPTGAIRLTAIDEEMTAAAFTFDDNRIVAPLESAVSFQGPQPITQVAITRLMLEQAGDAALVDVRPDARGEATFIDTLCPSTAAWRLAPESSFTVMRHQDGAQMRLVAALPPPARLLPAGEPATRAPDWILEQREDFVDLQPPAATDTRQRWGGAQDLSARIWLSRDQQDLRIHAEVRDDLAYQIDEAMTAWRGDGVQIGIQVPGQVGFLEIGVALHNDGRLLRSLWTSPGGGVAATAESFTATAQRNGPATTYEVIVPRKLLGLTDAVLASGIRFNLLVNDNDGTMRKGFLRIAPGLGENKQPTSFPLLILK